MYHWPSWKMISGAPPAAADEVLVVVHTEVEQVCRTVDGGLRVLAVALRAEEIVAPVGS